MQSPKTAVARWVMALLACLFVLMPSAYGDACTPVGADYCVCEMGDGKGIDLRPVGSTWSGWFQAGDGMEYAWSPCRGTLDFGPECTADTGAALCQGPTTRFSLGKVTSASFDVARTVTPTRTTLTYTGGDAERKAVVTLVCMQEQNSFIFTGEEPALNYQFTYTGPSACISSDPDKPEEHHDVTVSISAGSVMLIIFFVGLAFYFVVGALFMRFGRHAEGSEVVPNKSFWTGLPGLIKDGGLFLISPCRGGGSEKAYEQL